MSDNSIQEPAVDTPKYITAFIVTLGADGVYAATTDISTPFDTERKADLIDIRRASRELYDKLVELDTVAAVTAALSGRATEGIHLH